MALHRLAGGLLGGDGSVAAESRPIAGHLAGERILAPLLTADAPALTDQIAVASALAQGPDASLTIANPVTVPEQTPRGLHREVSDEADRLLLDWALARAQESTPDADGRLLYARRVERGLDRYVERADVDTLVLPRATGGGLGAGTADRIARRVDCDAVVVNGRPGYDSPPSLLLPVAGGPHSGLAADVAQRVAAEADGWIDVLHVVDADAGADRRERAREYVEAAADRIARPETTTTWVLEADDPVATIVEQSGYYALTVIGAPTTGRLRRFLSGSTNSSIRSDARSVVLSAHNHDGSGSLADD